MNSKSTRAVRRELVTTAACYMTTAETYLHLRSRPAADDTVRDAHQGNNMAGFYAAALAASIAWVGEAHGAEAAAEFAEFVHSELLEGGEIDEWNADLAGGDHVPTTTDETK